MKNNFQTLISAILTKVSSTYANKDEVSSLYAKKTEVDAATAVVTDTVTDAITALSNDVPIITYAEVGQTVIVKEVDKNGKPTAWEAGTSSPIPEPTSSDNGKFLQVVNGAPVWMAIKNAEEATFGG